MQSLALENYGTSELSFDEQRETDGGNPALIGYAVACISYFLIESATNPTSSVKNLQDGYNSVRNKH
ncbi:MULTISPECIES: hypothetical protein [Emticicia]|uniref:hypothetical protein n=1 Tax=Emticicia TaxID=312278 RepID=UPI0007D8B27A|nr:MULTISPECIES: hypothetical protein [Emticicia]